MTAVLFAITLLLSCTTTYVIRSRYTVDFLKALLLDLPYVFIVVVWGIGASLYLVGEYRYFIDASSRELDYYVVIFSGGVVALSTVIYIAANIIVESVHARRKNIQLTYPGFLKLCLLIDICTRVWVIYQVGPYRQYAGYNLPQYVVLLYTFLPPIILFSIYYKYRKTKSKWYAIAFVLYVVLVMATGLRRLLVFAVAPCVVHALLYTDSPKRLVFWLLIVLIPAGLLLQAHKQTVRQIAVTGIDNGSLVITYFSELSARLRPTLDTPERIQGSRLIRRVASYPALAGSVVRASNDRPLPARLLIDDIKMVIPFSGQNIDSDAKLNQTYLGRAPTRDLPSSPIILMYAYAGVLGVSVSLIIPFMLCGFIYFWSQKVAFALPFVGVYHILLIKGSNLYTYLSSIRNGIVVLSLMLLLLYLMDLALGGD
jgi:hypothetical protein